MSGADFSAADLLRDLKKLRKGRGVHADELRARVGSALRTVCSISPDDPDVVVRDKLVDRLRAWSAELGEDVRVVVEAAYALHPETVLPFQKERIVWAARRLGLEPRTVRRRMDHAAVRLSEIATGRRANGAGHDLPTQWRTEELRVALVLDGPEAVAYEFRRIVAAGDGVAELDLALTVTASAGREAGHDLDAVRFDMIFGGTLVDYGLESSDRFGVRLRLPGVLDKGQEHEFAMSVRLPPRHPMQPHFVCVPRYPCSVFDLRVRFAPRAAPRRVGKLVNVFQRDIDDPVVPVADVPVDAAGEIHVRFEHLVPGKASGVRWA